MKPSRLVVALVAVGAITFSASPVVSAQMSGQQNIVKTAIAAGEFKTLLSLLKTAGLASTLEGKGPFTVFAPTDAAFAKVPKSTLNALGKNKSELRKVLLYHVAAGRLTAAEVVKMHSIKTLEGSYLPVHVSGSTVTVGSATVIKANVQASNGIIHVINKVLIPTS